MKGFFISMDNPLYNCTLQDGGMRSLVHLLCFSLQDVSAVLVPCINFMGLMTNPPAFPPTTSSLHPFI